MKTDRGTVVCDERIFHIQNVWIAEGLLHIDASLKGPQQYAGGETEFSVFGPDGVLFISAQEVDMPAFNVNHVSYVHSDFTVAVTDKVGKVV